MDARFGIGLIAGLLIGWVLYRDWKQDRVSYWPQVDNSYTARFRRIVSGRLH